MKKLVSFAVSLMLLVSLAACGKTNDAEHLDSNFKAEHLGSNFKIVAIDSDQMMLTVEDLDDLKVAAQMFSLKVAVQMFSVICFSAGSQRHQQHQRNCETHQFFHVKHLFLKIYLLSLF